MRDGKAVRDRGTRRQEKVEIVREDKGCERRRVIAAGKGRKELFEKVQEGTPGKKRKVSA